MGVRVNGCAGVTVETVKTMKRRTLLLAAAALALAPLSTARAQSGPTGFLNKTVTVEGTSYPYVVYVPKDYSAGTKWPVVLFLHGAGERGSDGLKQSDVGIGRALRFYSERYPAVVVMPQCATGVGWSGKMADQALKGLDQTMAEYSIDPDRQYLTGLSMGGYGSFLMASQHPDRFAAVVPICGGGQPSEMAEKLKNIPMWVFHGDADKAVPVERSRQMVEAIKTAGGTKVKYTEYPGVEHNSWDRAYSEKELPEWLFAQRRQR
jgi:predicted peptidase